MTQEEASLRRVAEALAGAPPRSLRRVGLGRNSRVYRLTTDTGIFALKWYPEDASDRRKRLVTEFAALKLLHGHAAVPKALAAAEDMHCALYEWIEGQPVATHGTDDVSALLAFFRVTHTLRFGAVGFGEASEACLSEAGILEQLDRRRGRLGTRDDSRLQIFLRAYDRALMRIRPKSADAALLDPAYRTLSPSDAGFHNALRRPTGELAFIDLEYFGWDDPVKLVADILWHPGMTLSPAQRTQFLQGSEHIYCDDIRFASRLSARYSLFGLRWVLIILNEFLDPVWKRRTEAGERRPRYAVEDNQLAKATILLDEVRQNSRGIENYAH